MSNVVIPTQEQYCLSVTIDLTDERHVGVVELTTKNENGKPVQSQYEIDFIVNTGRQKIYIQSALNVDTPEKKDQETCSLKNSGDFFRKIVVLDGNQKLWTDDDGISYVGVIPFLIDENIL